MRLVAPNDDEFQSVQPPPFSRCRATPIDISLVLQVVDRIQEMCKELNQHINDHLDGVSAAIVLVFVLTSGAGGNEHRSHHSQVHPHLSSEKNSAARIRVHRPQDLGHSDAVHPLPGPFRRTLGNSGPHQLFVRTLLTCVCSRHCIATESGC